jgi:hypothetical protein
VERKLKFVDRQKYFELFSKAKSTYVFQVAISLNLNSYWDSRKLAELHVSRRKIQKKRRKKIGRKRGREKERERERERERKAFAMISKVFF